MDNKVEVKTSVGVWELTKPKAGPRNRAMMKAETDSGNLRRTVLVTELLPMMVARRPEMVDKDVPISQVLDSLEMEDYDLLAGAAAGLIVTKMDDDRIEEKKK